MEGHESRTGERKTTEGAHTSPSKAACTPKEASPKPSDVTRLPVNVPRTLDPSLTMQEMKEKTKLPSSNTTETKKGRDVTMSHTGVPLTFASTTPYLRPSQTVKFPRKGPYHDPLLVHGVRPWEGGPSRKGAYMPKLHRLGSPGGPQTEVADESFEDHETKTLSAEDDEFSSPKLTLVAALGDVGSLLNEYPQVKESLKRIKLPQRDPSFIRIDESKIPFSMFDDDTFETIEDPGQVTPEELGRSPLYRNYKWEWKLVHVLSFDAENKRYMVRFSGSSKIKKVGRLDLCFLRENVSNFQKRLLIALYNREKFKLELRKRYLVATHPGLSSEAISTTAMFQILMRIYSSPFPRISALNRVTSSLSFKKSAMEAFNWFNPLIPTAAKVFFNKELKNTLMEQEFEDLLQMLQANVSSKDSTDISKAKITFMDSISAGTARVMLVHFHSVRTSKLPRDISDTSEKRKSIEHLLFSRILDSLCLASEAIRGSFEELISDYEEAGKTAGLYSILRGYGTNKDTIAAESRQLNIQAPVSNAIAPYFGKIQIKRGHQFHRGQVKAANSIRYGDKSVVQCLSKLSYNWTRHEHCSFFAYKPPLSPCCGATEVRRVRKIRRSMEQTAKLENQLSVINISSLLRLGGSETADGTSLHKKSDAVFSVADFPLTLENFMVLQEEHMTRVAKCVLEEASKDTANILVDNVAANRYDFYISNSQELYDSDAFRLLTLVESFRSSHIHVIWKRSLENFTALFKEYAEEYPLHPTEPGAFDHLDPLLSVNFSLSSSGKKQWSQLYKHGWISSYNIVQRRVELDPESGVFVFKACSNTESTTGLSIQITNSPIEVLRKVLKLLDDLQHEICNCPSIPSLCLAISSVCGEGSKLVSLQNIEDSSLVHWYTPLDTAKQSISSLMQKLFNPMLDICERLQDMCWIFTVDPENVFEYVLTQHSPLPVEDIFSLVHQVQDLKTRIKFIGAGEKNLGFVHLEFPRVISQLVEQAIVVENTLLDKLAEKARLSAKEVHSQYDAIIAELKVLPQNEEELSNQRDYMKRLPEILDSIYSQSESLRKFVHGAERFHFKLKPSDIELFWTLLRRPGDVFDARVRCDFSLNQEKTRMISRLEKEKQQFLKDLKRADERVEVFSRSTDAKNIVSIVDEANQIDYQLRTLSEKAAGFATREQHLGFGVVTYSLLESLNEEFDSTFRAWTTLAEFQSKSQQWMNGPLEDIDFADLRKETEEARSLANSLMSTRDDITESTRVAAQELRDSTEIYTQLIPLLEQLLSHEMREHHWEILRQKTKLAFLGTTSCTLAQLVNGHILKKTDKVAEVFKLAEEESQLRQNYNKITAYWGKQEYPLKNLATLECPILGDCREILATIEEDLVTLQNLICSPHAQRLVDGCLKLQKTLKSMQSLVPFLLEVQQLWKYCSQIVGNRYLIQQLPNAKRLFKASDNGFRSLLSDVTDSPLAINIVEKDSLSHILRENKAQLLKVKDMVLEELAESQKHSPRLGFLSKDDIISFYYCVGSPEEWEKFAAKSFHGISRLHLRPKKHPEENSFVDAVGTMHKPLGWMVLDEAIPAEMFVHNVGDFLLELDRCSKRSLAMLIDSGIKHFQQKEFINWIRRCAVQPCLLALNIVCSRMVEETLESGQSAQSPNILLFQSLREQAIQELKSADCGRGMRLKLQFALLTVGQYLDVTKLENDRHSHWMLTPKYDLEGQTPGAEPQVTMSAAGVTIKHGLSILDSYCALHVKPLTERCLLALLPCFQQSQLACVVKNPSRTHSRSLKAAACLCGYEPWLLDSINIASGIRPEHWLKAALATSSWAIADFDALEEGNIWHCVSLAYNASKVALNTTSTGETLTHTPVPHLFFLSSADSKDSLAAHVTCKFRTLSMITPSFQQVVKKMLCCAGSPCPSRMAILVQRFAECIHSLHTGWTFKNVECISYFLLDRILQACCVYDWDVTYCQQRRVCSDLFSEAIPGPEDNLDTPHRDAELTSAFKNILQEKGWIANGATIGLVLKVYRLFEDNDTAIIYGQSLGGKTVVFNAALELYRTLKSPNITSMRVKYIGYNEQGMSMKALYRFVRHRSKSCRGDHEWVIKVDCCQHAKGVIDTLLQEALGTNRENTKLCIEAASVQDISPASLCSGSMTFFDGSHFSWNELLMSRLAHERVNEKFHSKIRMAVEGVLPILYTCINNFPSLPSFVSMEQLMVLWWPVFNHVQKFCVSSTNVRNAKWFEEACLFSLLEVCVPLVEVSQRSRVFTIIERLCRGQELPLGNVDGIQDYLAAGITDSPLQLSGNSGLKSTFSPMSDMPKTVTLQNTSFDYASGKWHPIKSVPSAGSLVSGSIFVPSNTAVSAATLAQQMNENGKHVCIVGDMGITLPFIRWYHRKPESETRLIKLNYATQPDELSTMITSSHKRLHKYSFVGNPGHPTSILVEDMHVGETPTLRELLRGVLEDCVVQEVESDGNVSFASIQDFQMIGTVESTSIKNFSLSFLQQFLVLFLREDTSENQVTTIFNNLKGFLCTFDLDEREVSGYTKTLVRVLASFRQFPRWFDGNNLCHLFRIMRSLSKSHGKKKVDIDKLITETASEYISSWSSFDPLFKTKADEVHNYLNETQRKESIKEDIEEVNPEVLQRYKDFNHHESWGVFGENATQGQDFRLDCDCARFLCSSKWLSRICLAIFKAIDEYDCDAMVKNVPTKLSETIVNCLAKAYNYSLVLVKDNSDVVADVDKVKSTLEMGAIVLVSFSIRNKQDERLFEVFRYAMTRANWNSGKEEGAPTNLHMVAFETRPIPSNIETYTSLPTIPIVVEAVPTEDEKQEAIREYLSERLPNDDVWQSMERVCSQLNKGFTSKYHQVSSLVTAYRMCIRMLESTIIPRRRALENVLEQTTAMATMVDGQKTHADTLKHQTSDIKKQMKATTDKIEYADAEVNELQDHVAKIEAEIDDKEDEFQSKATALDTIKEEEQRAVEAAHAVAASLTKTQLIALKKLKGDKNKATHALRCLHVLLFCDESKLGGTQEEKSVYAAVCKAETPKKMKTIDLVELAPERITVTDRLQEDEPKESLPEASEEETVNSIISWVKLIKSAAKCAKERHEAEKMFTELSNARDEKSKALKTTKDKLASVSQDAEDLRKHSNELDGELKAAKRDSSEALKRSALYADILQKIDVVKADWVNFIDVTRSVGESTEHVALCISIFLTGSTSWHECCTSVYGENSDKPSTGLLEEILYQIWNSRGITYSRYAIDITERFLKVLLSSTMGLIPLIKGIDSSTLTDFRTILNDASVIYLSKGQPTEPVKMSLSKAGTVFVVDLDEESSTSNFAPLLQALQQEKATYPDGSAVRVHPEVRFVFTCFGGIHCDYDDPLVHVVTNFVNSSYDFSRDVVRTCSQHAYLQRKKTQGQLQSQSRELLAREVSFMECVVDDFDKLSVPALDRMLEKLDRLAEITTEVNQLKELMNRQKTSLKRYIPIADRLASLFSIMEWINGLLPSFVFEVSHFMDVLQRVAKEKHKAGVELRDLLRSMVPDVTAEIWKTIRISLQEKYRMYWDVGIIVSLAQIEGLVSSEDAKKILDLLEIDTHSSTHECLPIKIVEEKLEHFEYPNDASSLKELTDAFRRQFSKETDSLTAQTLNNIIGSLLQAQWNPHNIVLACVEQYFGVESWTTVGFLRSCASNNFPVLINTDGYHSDAMIDTLIQQVPLDGERPVVHSRQWKEWLTSADKMGEANKNQWVLVVGLDSRDDLTVLLPVVESMRKERTHENFRLIISCATLTGIPSWLLQQTTLCNGCIESDYGGYRSQCDTALSFEDKQQARPVWVAGFAMSLFNLSRASFGISDQTAGRIKMCSLDLQNVADRSVKGTDSLTTTVIKNATKHHLTCMEALSDPGLLNVLIDSQVTEATATDDIQHRDPLLLIKLKHIRPHTDDLVRANGTVKTNDLMDCSGNYCQSVHMLKVTKQLDQSFIPTPLARLIAQRLIQHMREIIFATSVNPDGFVSTLPKRGVVYTPHWFGMRQAIRSAGELCTLRESASLMVNTYKENAEHFQPSLLSCPTSAAYYVLLKAQREDSMLVRVEFSKEGMGTSFEDPVTIYGAAYDEDDRIWKPQSSSKEETGFISLVFAGSETSHESDNIVEYPCPVYRKVMHEQDAILVQYGHFQLAVRGLEDIKSMFESRPYITLQK